MVFLFSTVLNRNIIYKDPLFIKVLKLKSNPVVKTNRSESKGGNEPSTSHANYTTTNHANYTNHLNKIIVENQFKVKLSKLLEQVTDGKSTSLLRSLFKTNKYNWQTLLTYLKLIDDGDLSLYFTLRTNKQTTELRSICQTLYGELDKKTYRIKEIDLVYDLQDICKELLAVGFKQATILQDTIVVKK